jgi:hypothetical protein
MATFISMDRNTVLTIKPDNSVIVGEKDGSTWDCPNSVYKENGETKVIYGIESYISMSGGMQFTLNQEEVWQTFIDKSIKVVTFTNKLFDELSITLPLTVIHDLGLSKILLQEQKNDGYDSDGSVNSFATAQSRFSPPDRDFRSADSQLPSPPSSSSAAPQQQLSPSDRDFGSTDSQFPVSSYPSGASTSTLPSPNSLFLEKASSSNAASPQIPVGDELITPEFMQSGVTITGSKNQYTGSYHNTDNSCMSNALLMLKHLYDDGNFGSSVIDETVLNAKFLDASFRRTLGIDNNNTGIEMSTLVFPDQDDMVFTVLDKSISFIDQSIVGYTTLSAASQKHEFLKQTNEHARLQDEFTIGDTTYSITLNSDENSDAKYILLDSSMGSSLHETTTSIAEYIMMLNSDAIKDGRKMATQDLKEKILDCQNLIPNNDVGMTITRSGKTYAIFYNRLNNTYFFYDSHGYGGKDDPAYIKIYSSLDEMVESLSLLTVPRELEVSNVAFHTANSVQIVPVEFK